MSTKSRQVIYGVIYGGRIIGAKIRATEARKAAQKAAREADRAEAEAVVNSDGRLRWTSAALANHRSMPQRRIGLARSGMQPL